jgi:hypothetical protein
VKRKPQRDRRRSVRYRPNADCACQALLLLGEDRWPARVRNVSTEGICLVLDSPFPPGTRCVVELVNQLGLFTRRLSLEIVHVSRTDDNRFMLGGPFIEARLRIEEVWALLA